MFIFARNIYYRSVIVATLVAWLFGALWYSPLLFWDVWASSPIVRNPQDIDPVYLGPLVSLGIGFITAYSVHGIASFCGLRGLAHGIALSLWLGLGIIVLNMLGGYMFMLVSWEMAIADAGFMYIRFLIYCIFATLWCKKLKV